MKFHVILKFWMKSRLNSPCLANFTISLAIFLEQKENVAKRKSKESMLKRNSNKNHFEDKQIA